MAACDIRAHLCNQWLKQSDFSWHFMPFLSAAGLAEEDRFQEIRSPDYFKNAGILSPAMICSNVSRALTSSNTDPLTSTSAGSERVLYRLAMT